MVGTHAGNIYQGLHDAARIKAIFAQPAARIVNLIRKLRGQKLIAAGDHKNPLSLPKTISGNIGGANRRGYLVRRWFRGAQRACA